MVWFVMAVKWAFQVESIVLFFPLGNLLLGAACNLSSINKNVNKVAGLCVFHRISIYVLQVCLRTETNNNTLSQAAMTAHLNCYTRKTQALLGFGLPFFKNCPISSRTLLITWVISLLPLYPLETNQSCYSKASKGYSFYRIKIKAHCQMLHLAALKLDREKSFHHSYFSTVVVCIR